MRLRANLGYCRDETDMMPKSESQDFLVVFIFSSSIACWKVDIALSQVSDFVSALQVTYLWRRVRIKKSRKYETSIKNILTNLWTNYEQLLTNLMVFIICAYFHSFVICLGPVPKNIKKYEIKLKINWTSWNLWKQCMNFILFILLSYFRAYMFHMFVHISWISWFKPSPWGHVTCNQSSHKLRPFVSVSGQVLKRH